MKRTTQILLLAALAALGLTTAAAGAEDERYIVILKRYSGPMPEVARLGGTIEFRQQEQLVVRLPPGAIELLRRDPLVKYVEKVGGAEEGPLIGTPAEPTPGAEPGRLRPASTALRPQPDGALSWDSGTYSYDGAGNISGIGTSKTYVYDELQRLTKATISGVADTYTYDEYGNMTSKKVGGTTQVFPTVDTTTNRFNSSGYTYDAAGNLTSDGASDGAWSFSYDALGQPVSKRYNNTNQAYYVYTASDERVGVQENGWWYWSLRDEGGKVLRQYRTSASDPAQPTLWLEDFVWRDGLLLGSQRPAEMGGRRHFHLDHLGTPRLITSDSAQQVSLHDYYPFGDEQTLVVQEGPGAGGFDREEPMKFTGHERDFAGGEGREDAHYVDYMHARYYSPVQGRFLSPDPMLGNLLQPGSWNRYVYVFNSPVNFMDPHGLAARNHGEKMQPGDTCPGEVIDGWCTDGEKITVRGDTPKIDPQRLALELALFRLQAYVEHEHYATRGAFSKISWHDAPILRPKKAVPCKGYWGRFLQSEIDTNALPGLAAPTGTGMITAAATARAGGAITLFQWARSGFGVATMNGVSYNATETALIAGGTAVVNFAFVSLAYEGGVGIGSAVNAALTDGCD